MPEPAGPFVDALASRYQIQGVLGEGGMATVYRATELAHGRTVAIKVLRPELSAVLGTERFLLEIAVTARLDHPHIVALFDSGEAAGRLYYAMPFVNGESLADRLKRDGRLPVADAVNIAREVAGALQYAHDHDVIHRDIKPQNIMLSAGHARVADFGIARAISEGGASNLTGTGFAVGTPSYMSPEQAEGTKIDARSDVYSLASVLYEMLAGEPPYTGPTMQAIITKRWKDPVPSVSTVRATISPALEAVVTKGLAKDAVDRYASAAEFSRALDQALRPSVAALRPRPATPWTAGLGWGVAAAVAIVAGGAWWWTRRPSAAARIDRVAILPFTVRLRDSAGAYLATGLYDGLTAEVSQLASVVVIARGSVSRFADAGKSDQEIGQGLKASTLVKGTATWVDDSVRLTIELVDPAAGTAQTYVASSTAGLAMGLPRAAGRWIGTRLGRLSGGDAERQTPVDSVALAEYLKARHHVVRETPADIDLTEMHITQSLRADSTYAPAYSLLARHQVNQMFRGLVAPDIAFDRAKAAARRAIALDDRVAEAHYQLGLALALYDWDWAGAEREFKRALELNPSDAGANMYYGFFLSWVKRPREALQYAQRAVGLDPVSPGALVNEATIWVLNRQPDTAVVELKEAIRLDPTYTLAFERLGLAYESKPDIPNAILAYRQALALYPADPQRLASLAGAYAKAGRTDTARAILADLLAREKKSYVSPFAIATIYAALGEPDPAIDWLERTYRGRHPEMAVIQVLPLWDRLRDQPRYKALESKMKFP